MKYERVFSETKVPGVKCQALVSTNRESRLGKRRMNGRSTDDERRKPHFGALPNLKIFERKRPDCEPPWQEVCSGSAIKAGLKVPAQFVEALRAG